MPAVSIILPVYRAGGTLSAAVRSIERQSFTDWELTIVCNGSDPQTLQIARGLRSRQIRCMELARADVSLAFNAALENAQGEFVARMDADDMCHRERLAAQVAALRARPELALVATRVRYGGRAGPVDGFRRYVAWQNELCSPAEIRGQRFVEAPLANPTMMARREVLVAMGGYHSGDFPEDYDLWLRMLGAGHRLAKLPRRLLVWRDHPSRLTRADPRYREAAFHRVKAAHLGLALRAAGVRSHPAAHPAAHPATHPAVTHVTASDRVADRPLVIWGTGQVARRHSGQLLAQGFRPESFVEIAPGRIGQRRHGVPVISPQMLAARCAHTPPAARPFVVSYVPGAAARTTIARALSEMDLHIERDYLPAA